RSHVRCLCAEQRSRKKEQRSADLQRWRDDSPNRGGNHESKQRTFQFSVTTKGRRHTSELRSNRESLVAHARRIPDPHALRRRAASRSSAEIVSLELVAPERLRHSSRFQTTL